MTGLHALILAAGSGSRFGGGKLMAPWREGVLIDGAIAAALAAPAEAILGVVGADAQVARYLASKDIRTVTAKDHALGLSASLKAGVAALPSSASGVLIFLGDMPLVPHAVLAPLAEALDAGAPAAAPEFDGRLGHPVALSARLFPQVLALQGDRGARALLEALGEALVRISAPDDGVLLDVDRPDQLPI